MLLASTTTIATTTAKAFLSKNITSSAAFSQLSQSQTQSQPQTTTSISTSKTSSSVNPASSPFSSSTCSVSIISKQQQQQQQTKTTSLPRPPPPPYQYSPSASVRLPPLVNKNELHTHSKANSHVLSSPLTTGRSSSLSINKLNNATNAATKSNSSVKTDPQLVKQSDDQRSSISIISITNSPSNGISKVKKSTSSASSTTTLSKQVAKLKTNSKAGTAVPVVTTAKKTLLSPAAPSSSKLHSQKLNHRDPLQRARSSGRPQLAGSRSSNSISSKANREWHAPDAYMYDYARPGALTADQLEVVQSTQAFWFKDILNENLLTREQRLEVKRDNLRRQAYQYAQAETFRSTTVAKRRLTLVSKTLRKFKTERAK